jgi:hypothetical protein
MVTPRDRNASQRRELTVTPGHTAGGVGVAWTRVSECRDTTDDDAPSAVQRVAMAVLVCQPLRMGSFTVGPRLRHVHASPRHPRDGASSAERVAGCDGMQRVVARNNTKRDSRAELNGRHSMRCHWKNRSRDRK